MLLAIVIDFFSLTTAFMDFAIYQTHLSAAMDQYKTKEDVLKMGIVDPELEEVS